MDGAMLDVSEAVTLWHAEDPARQIGYCPTIVRLSTGRYVAAHLVNDRPSRSEVLWTVHVYTSDDACVTWAHRTSFEMVNCQLFEAEDGLYLIGGLEDLMVARSTDGGETWSDLVPLETGQAWYAYPGSMISTGDRVYLVKDCRTEPVMAGYPVWILAPVVMSADLSADLTQRDAWAFSDALGFQQVVERYGHSALAGVPFYTPGSTGSPGRAAPQTGWGEGNLVQIHDPDHVWHDPTGRTLHIFLRASTGRTNLACLAKAVVGDDGGITVDLEHAPSGEPMLYVPLPGGHGSFQILFDAHSSLYWLISSMSTDSMRPVGRLHARHYGMPDNERRRLALHFSRNCVDWCFGGLIAVARSDGESHYGANAVIDGDDLVLLSRESDGDAVNEHNSNRITCRRVQRFRDTAY